MKNYERGSTITESMLCFIVLIILTFGFLGIFQLFTTKIATEYGAYQAARARSLGYNDAIVMRAGRLGVAAVSGPDISAVPLPNIDNSYLISATATAHAKDYLNYGWGRQRVCGQLRLLGSRE